MPRLGARSIDRLQTCCSPIQQVMLKAIERVDFTVICGHRGQAEQDKAYSERKSKLKFPQSKHNKQPSLAIDIAPWPIDWKDIARFKQLGTYIIGVADGMGIKMRWGGDWDGDFDLGDQRFNDMPHFEIVDG